MHNIAPRVTVYPFRLDAGLFPGGRLGALAQTAGSKTGAGIRPTDRHCNHATVCRSGGTWFAGSKRPQAVLDVEQVRASCPYRSCPRARSSSEPTLSAGRPCLAPRCTQIGRHRGCYSIRPRSPDHWARALISVWRKYSGRPAGRGLAPDALSRVGSGRHLCSFSGFMRPQIPD